MKFSLLALLVIVPWCASQSSVSPLDAFCNSSSGNECVEQPARIGTWNVNRLGPTKAGKDDVIYIMAQVIRRYDIIVIQEVTDASFDAQQTLLAKVNEFLNPDDQYLMEESPRVGRTNFKEQYVIFYKPSRVTNENATMYNDVGDKFDNDPYIIHFSTTVMGELTDFILITLNVYSDDAPAEINELATVYDNMVTEWGIEDAIILGDFSAGCSFVTQSEFSLIELFTNEEKFTTVISSTEDSTVTTSTGCPYDRIVLAGDVMKSSAYVNTGSVYRYEEDLGIEDNDLVGDVSDHYPVEMLIRGTVPASVSAAHPAGTVTLSLSVHLSPACWSAVSKMLEDEDDSTKCNCKGKPKHSKIYYADWTEPNMDAAIQRVIDLAADNPDVISPEAVAVLGYKASHDVLEDHLVYIGDEASEPSEVTVRLFCRREDKQTPPYCTLSLNADTTIN